VNESIDIVAESAPHADGFNWHHFASVESGRGIFHFTLPAPRSIRSSISAASLRDSILPTQVRGTRSANSGLSIRPSANCIAPIPIQWAAARRAAVKKCAETIATPANRPLRL
jgi:hypothetical protein